MLFRQRCFASLVSATRHVAAVTTEPFGGLYVLILLVIEFIDKQSGFALGHRAPSQLLIWHWQDRQGARDLRNETIV